MVRAHFGFPGFGVDELLAADPEVVITSDEFAAGCAAMGHYLASGVTARVSVMDGPGLEVLMPALLMAAREEIPVDVVVGDEIGWEAMALPQPTPSRLGRGGATPPVVLVRPSDLDRIELLASEIRRTGIEAVTSNPCVPLARWVGAQWIGHLGYAPTPAALASVRERRVLSGDQLGELPDGSGVRAATAEPGTAHVGTVGSLAQDLDAGLPTRSVMIADAGTVHFAVAHHVATRGQRAVLMTRGLTTMGWSLAAALGVHRAHPDVPIGVMIGDATLLSRLGDLAVLARYRVPAVIVVSDNRAHASGWRRLARVDRARVFGVPAVDWGGAIRSMGVQVAPSIDAAVRACGSGPQVVLRDTTVGRDEELVGHTGLAFLDDL